MKVLNIISLIISVMSLTNYAHIDKHTHTDISSYSYKFVH